METAPTASVASLPRTSPQRDACLNGPVPICFPFVGGVVGGSHISVVKLIQRLDRTRFSPLIVLHHEVGQLNDFLRAEGLPFVTLSGANFFGRSYGVSDAGRTKAGACLDQWRLARFLKQNRVRIVHTNDGSMHVSWALPAHLAGAKLLWHHRGNIDARGLRYLAPIMAHHIVGVSKFALTPVLRSRRTSRKTAVVYSPFDIDLDPVDRAHAHRALVTELQTDPETKLIGFFGHLQERKRPLAFVDSIACIAQSRPDLKVMGLMFGTPLIPGIEAQLVDRARSLGIEDRIRLMGFRYPSAPLMAGCDVHAVPAVGEPFGRSLIEAMLLGTPVVAAASGGNIEAIEHGLNGMLSKADDPAAMANAIIELLDSPARAAAMAATARIMARERYPAERHVEQISAIYQSLLNDRAGASW